MAPKTDAAPLPPTEAAAAAELADSPFPAWLVAMDPFLHDPERNPLFAAMNRRRRHNRGLWRMLRRHGLLITTVVLTLGLLVVIPYLRVVSFAGIPVLLLGGFVFLRAALRDLGATRNLFITIDFRVVDTNRPLLQELLLCGIDGRHLVEAQMLEARRWSFLSLSILPGLLQAGLLLAAWAGGFLWSGWGLLYFFAVLWMNTELFRLLGMLEVAGQTTLWCNQARELLAQHGLRQRWKDLVQFLLFFTFLIPFIGFGIPLIAKLASPFGKLVGFLAVFASENLPSFFTVHAGAIAAIVAPLLVGACCRFSRIWGTPFWHRRRLRAIEELGLIYDIDLADRVLQDPDSVLLAKDAYRRYIGPRRRTLVDGGVMQLD